MDLPNFLKTVSNLRYSILYHHGQTSQKQFLTKDIQASLSLEPNDISKDINKIKQQNQSNGEDIYYHPTTDINQFTPLCQFTQTSFDKVHGDEIIVNVLKYLNQN